MKSLVGLLVVSLLCVSVTHADRSIEVDRSCYESGQEIEITFDNTDGDGPRPQPNDWVAVYRLENLDLDDLSSQPAMWLRTCNSQSDCTDSRDGGTVEFGPGGPDETQLDPAWPLDSGRYRAVLSGGERPYEARAVSDVFTVLSQGESCDEDDKNIFDEGDSDMVQVVARARADIEALIDDDSRLGPKFLRLAFHDCVGGCDGCVDLSSQDNAGLGLPIDRLRPVVDEYEDLGLSRTDIWMLAAVVASDVAQDRLSFPFQWIGRQTCRQRMNNDCGSSECTATRGPNRSLCHGDSGTTTILEFFEDEFGFDPQQVAAIMGAHSVGRMTRRTLGFDARNGWDLSNDELDHGYYVELVGRDPDDPPDWQLNRVDNGDLDDIPDRPQWELTTDGETLTMLHSDIALVRQIDNGNNINNDGSVDCTFKGSNACPVASRTMEFMVEYANSRRTFLRDFREVLDLMIENGYERTGNCPDGQVCRLQVN